MTAPLTRTDFDQYVKFCTSRESPQAYRAAFELVLDAVHALEEEPTAADTKLANDFWQTTIWLGIYDHFGLSIDDFLGRYKNAGSLSLHLTIFKTKHIAGAWGADFWHHLRRRRINIKAVPAKNTVEQLHKASSRGVSLADFAGGLSRWLADYLGRADQRRHKKWGEQREQGTYVLQYAALRQYFVELDITDKSGKPVVVEEADPAGSDDEAGLGESESESEEASEPPSIERHRGAEHQPLDDDDSALGLNFDGFDDSVQSSTVLFDPPSPTADPTTDAAMVGTRNTRAQTEGPSPLHGAGTPQQRTPSAPTPRTPRTSGGRVVKPSRPKSQADPIRIHKAIGSAIGQEVLKALRQVRGAVKNAQDHKEECIQEASDARAELQAESEAETQLGRNIGQQLKLDKIPTVQDLHDLRATREAYVTSVQGALVLLNNFRAQAETAGSQNIAVSRITISADEDGMAKDIADAQNAAEALGELANNMIAAQHKSQKAEQKVAKAQEKLNTVHEEVEGVMDLLGLGFGAQQEFLELEE